MYTHTDKHIYSTNILIYILIHTYSCIYTHIYTQLHTYTYIHTHIYVLIHTYSYICTHTYIYSYIYSSWQKHIHNNHLHHHHHHHYHTWWMDTYLVLKILVGSLLHQVCNNVIYATPSSLHESSLAILFIVIATATVISNSVITQHHMHTNINWYILICT